MATDLENSLTAERKTAETLDLTPAAPPSANPDRLKGSPGPAVVEASKKTEADAGPDSEIIAPVSDTEKKIRRAERFGITVQLSEEEKRNSRAERFGSGSSSNGTEASKKSEDLKRKARAERFGMVVPPSATDEEMKKKARLERFASTPKIDAQEEDKRKARALRFSQPQSSSVSINGKEDMKPKTAIAGEAAGGS